MFFIWNGSFYHISSHWRSLKNSFTNYLRTDPQSLQYMYMYIWLSNVCVHIYRIIQKSHFDLTMGSSLWTTWETIYFSIRDFYWYDLVDLVAQQGFIRRTVPHPVHKVTHTHMQNIWCPRKTFTIKKVCALVCDCVSSWSKFGGTDYL